MIQYKEGYKYQLVADYKIDIGIDVPKIIKTPFITLDTKGWLKIKKGYAWDGPSGPTIDTKNFMRAALVHDALYQLIREGQLNKDIHKPIADQLMHDLCIEDGMSRFRAWYCWFAVSKFADKAASESGIRPVHTAP